MIHDITDQLVIDAQARHWCKLPYPGHPKGCPNYGRKKGCPPQVNLVMAEFDLGKPHWLAAIPFDLAAHVARMKERHPFWSFRQATCCLYWQGTAKKKLRQECEKFMFMRPDLSVNYCPEAMGIDIFRTCEKLGIELDRKPRTLVYKVALIGYLNEDD